MSKKDFEKFIDGIGKNKNTNKNNNVWSCPICGNNSYRTVEREKKIDNEGKITWVAVKHFCKGCTIYFRDPARFCYSPTMNRNGLGIM